MKLLVLSDTHGYLGHAEKVINKIGKSMDIILHLGDHDSDAERLAKMYPNKPFHWVQGNNDGYNETPYEKMILCRGKKILLTHGHRQQVYWDNDKLVYWALEQEADVVLYGHTHVPYLDYEGSLLVMNPGSISLPRMTPNPTFGILDISESGCIEGTLMELKENQELGRLNPHF